MVYNVVISHHQTENINKFPKNSVIVFDDVTENDIKECESNNIPYVLSKEKGNRSINRNTGLYYILNNYDIKDNDIIQFFDGDRYPVDYNIENVINLMETHKVDVMLYSCQYDKRHTKIFVPLEGAVIIDTGTLCNPFYSCGFAITVNAIRKIMEFNNNSFFETSFIYWGGEDQYMGLICDKIELKVGLTCEILLNGNVGGDQEEHPDYKKSMQNYINLIRKYNLPIRNSTKESYIIK